MSKKIGLFTGFLSSVLLLFLLSSCLYTGTTVKSGITIESATYGANCDAATGNVTDHIAAQCNGEQKCRYVVDYKIIGDPALGCSKTYTVQYRCGNDNRVIEKSLSAEAGWGDKAIDLECL